MSNYYWNDTNCIRSDDNLEVIELALTRMLEQEGCRRISMLPPPPKNIESMSIYFLYAVPNLWIVGLFPGAAGWTIVKTSPHELLCRRALGATRSRLSALAIQLGRDAFHLSVYGNNQGMLIEADARGRTFVSGYVDRSEREEYEFYSEQINEREKPLQFFLLEVPEQLQAAMRVNRDEEKYRKYEDLMVLRDEQAERVTDPNSGLEEMEKLFKLEHQIDELLMGSFQIIDKALWQLIGGPHFHWYPNKNLAYLAYTQQQQLEAQGARLLYFQPAEHY